MKENEFVPSIMLKLNMKYLKIMSSLSFWIENSFRIIDPFVVTVRNIVPSYRKSSSYNCTHKYKISIQSEKLHAILEKISLNYVYYGRLNFSDSAWGFLDHTVLFSIKCKTTVNIIYLNDVSRNICTRWLVDVINFHYCVNSIAPWKPITHMSWIKGH